MAEQTTSTIVVNATPKQIMAVIADFAAYPEWADSMRETEVLSTDEAGRPKQVRFKVDAGAISDEYTLDYTWSRNEVTWTLVQAKTEGKVSDVAESLVVFREEQSDGSFKHDYLLSNEIASDPPLEMAWAYQAEHRIEECLKQAKSEAGLADYLVPQRGSQAGEKYRRRPL